MSQTKFRIAVLGGGNVGRTLGEGWAKAGHEVLYGSRHPEGDDQKTHAEASAWANVVVLATPYSAIAETLTAAGDLTGKVLVDCTNPIAADFSGLSVGHTSSAGEEVAALAPGAHVVKAFNTVGFNVMADPLFGTEAASMLIAGDAPEAKATVATLAADLGFEAVDAGPLNQSRLLEPMAWLWITMALKYGHGREIAFRLLTR